MTFTVDEDVRLMVERYNKLLGIIQRQSDMLHELNGLMLKIHYARVAMREDLVVKYLDEIDKRVRRADNE